MKNRIKEHRKIRAGDLVPHELNPRVHTDQQKDALQDLYNEIGFARSVLAYPLPDGRLKLIDGHLRQSMDPEAIIDVEVLDVTDEEARKLLLSIDPLAQLADYDTQAVASLIDSVNTDSQAVQDLWTSLAANDKPFQPPKTKPPQTTEEKFLLIVECENERHQVTLLKKLKKEGLTCHAKIS